jgi:hypothetical protein
MVELRKYWRTGLVVVVLLTDFIVLKDIVETVMKMGHN